MSNEEIAKRVKDRRQQLKMSQEELAFRCGYKGRSSINKIEKGMNAINADLLVRLASALDVPVQWLAGVDEQTTSDIIRNLIGELTPDEQEMVLRMIKGLIAQRYAE